MKELTINGCEIGSAEGLHRLLAQELDFPEYYGGNLSALYDCLTDIGEETWIELCLEKIQDEEFLQYLQQTSRVLEDAARENGYLHVKIKD